MLFPVVEVTRLLSNLIKYSFVNFDKSDAVVIGEEEKNFVPLTKSSRVKIRPADEVVAEEILKEQSKTFPVEKVQEAVNLDDVFIQKKREAEAFADSIIDGARVQSGKIMAQAKEEADRIFAEAKEEGMQLGLQEGLAASQQELEQLKSDLKEELKAKEKECEEYEAGLELKYTEVLCSLIQKLTGVLLSDKKDIMLHLIRSTVADMDSAKHYVIRVSSEDFVLVDSHKDEIRMKLGVDVTVDVQEEKGLQKDQCIIEADNQMVDCGFHTQLDNLISTLRMLAQ